MSIPISPHKLVKPIRSFPTTTSLHSLSLTFQRQPLVGDDSFNAVPIQTSQRFLQSNGGSVLPIEICLKIVESVLDQEPKALTVIARLSTRFYALLKDYEHSIITHIAKYDDLLRRVLPSCACPESVNVRLHSFRWLHEIRLRPGIIDGLAQHEISYMTGPRVHWQFVSLPTLDCPAPELAARLEMFKKKTMTLMYRLSDCTVGLTHVHKLRAKQREFLEELEIHELAALGVFVRTLGLGYQEVIKKQYPETDEIAMRECTTVFQDKVLRYGPYFAYAQIFGTPRHFEWAEFVMHQGLIDMEAFELGYETSYASLQSVIWVLFDKKMHCSIHDSWVTAKEMIQDELIKYEIEAGQMEVGR